MFIVYDMPKFLSAARKTLRHRYGRRFRDDVTVVRKPDVVFHTQHIVGGRMTAEDWNTLFELTDQADGMIALASEFAGPLPSKLQWGDTDAVRLFLFTGSQLYAYDIVNRTEYLAQTGEQPWV